MGEAENFSRLNLAFARFLSQRTKLQAEQKRILETLLATLSKEQHQGHSCIEIDQLEHSLLLASGLATENARPSSQSHPLVIEENRLYLQRYWFYEYRLAKQLKILAQAFHPSENLDSLLDRYFGTQGPETDWQKAAAKLACKRSLTIITGGPGTGKTTTVCKVLTVLQELSDEPLLIALAAPTGKAAMRLQEAIALNIADLTCPEAIKAHIPRTAYTLHRILGANPPSPYFKHDADNPLIFDVVIVDEASMVDLALMSKLVDALKPETRLILLGDKNQLTSVEAGSVLADLIDALPDNTVELKHAFRFDEAIKNLADAVNNQDYETAWRFLLADDPSTGILEQKRLIPYIIEQRADYQNLIKTSAPFADVFSSFSRFQVLCANRYGQRGTVELNAEIERALFHQSILHSSTGWYAGRPVMVLQNNPALHLYNGDIGICLPDTGQNGTLMVFFQRADGTIKKYLPTRLPNCETVFAMTIHKSQGSEFDEALIVLPETINPVLSKELLYAAITRAKRKITLLTEADVFTATVSKKTERVTGLADKLK